MIGSFDLLNSEGQRKYINQKERERLFQIVEEVSLEDKLFCQMLLWTGLRISEALSLKHSSIDYDEKLVIVKCLKKRQKVVFRRIPLPDHFLELLHDQCKLHTLSSPIWTWSRATASRHMDNIMAKANIAGTHANARGLRHSFALTCAQKNIPASVIKLWMGHAKISTTMIYMDFVMTEQRAFAERMWR